MPTENQQDGGERRPVRVLVFSASLRKNSLNDRLAALAASVAEQKGGVVDRVEHTTVEAR